VYIKLIDTEQTNSINKLKILSWQWHLF